MKESIFSRINKRISKLSKLALILILTIYALALVGIFALVNANKTYLVVPEYEHVYWDQQLNPQITIIGRRTFDEDNKMTLKYSVNVNVYGRINAESNVDPGYALTDFKMSAATVENVTSSVPNKMYYFTEYTTYHTPTTHYFTLDNSSVDQHPSTLYTMIQYKKSGKSAISTFKEDVFLYPDANDISKVDEYYASSGSSDATSRNIKGKNDEVIANIQFTSSDQGDFYSSGVKITMTNLGYSYKHHIDMQSWILTSDGKYLPFVGVYSYTQQKSNYSQSGISVYKQLNPQYIVSKLRYYFSENDYVDYYFKQDITKLPASFTTAPSAADEVEEGNKENKTLLIVIAVVLSCAIVACVVVLIIINKKRKNNDNQENQEVKEDIKIEEEKQE